MSKSVEDEKLGGSDEDELEDLETTASAPDESDDAAGDAETADGDDEDPAEQAVHPADALREAKPKLVVPAKQVPLDPQARDGLIRCLQARILELDTTLAHASEVAAKDPFYSRWPNVVTELRAQALKRLEELQRS